MNSETGGGGLLKTNYRSLREPLCPKEAARQSPRLSNKAGKKVVLLTFQVDSCKNGGDFLALEETDTKEKETA